LEGYHNHPSSFLYFSGVGRVTVELVEFASNKIAAFFDEELVNFRNQSRFADTGITSIISVAS
jgi:hypothetical protein